jgi:hypothetical protein
MYKQVKTLQNLVTRNGSSRVLSFSAPHVFKALQLLNEQKYVSRATFGKELHMGEGAVKTLIKHMKQDEIVKSIKAGTFLTLRGKRFVKKFLDVISAQCSIIPCNIVRCKYNHAILVKNFANLLGNGMQQRDYAILYGASGATTLEYTKNKFVFLGESVDCLSDEPEIKKTLVESLHPENNDVIIISSSDDPFVAEISAINSALWTLIEYEKN